MIPQEILKAIETLLGSQVASALVLAYALKLFILSPLIKAISLWEKRILRYLRRYRKQLENTANILVAVKETNAILRKGLQSESNKSLVKSEEQGF